MTYLASLRNDRGITLAEVLIAAAILAIGLAALMSVVPVASYGVQDGNQTSTATFLAQQRLEQVRNATWDATSDCVGLSPNVTSPPAPSPAATCGATAVTYPDEATVPGFAQYARTVRITDCGVTPCGAVTSPAMRLVMVTVTYRPLSAAGGSNSNTSVILEWLVAQRL
jgi:prepilin-type N-terminal cleavage/methylation domain-containing protein